MLENCPQIALQICALINTSDTGRTWYGGMEGEAANWGDYIRIISLVLSVITLITIGISTGILILIVIAGTYDYESHF